MINGKVTFPTHSEAAYPELLCQRMSSLLKDHLLKNGVVEVDSLPQQTASSSKSLNRVVLGALPRGKHVKPLVSEYGVYLNVIADVQQSETQLQQFMTKLPKGAAIQSRRILTWGEVRDALAKNIKKRELSNKLNQLKASQGIYPCAEEVVVDLDGKFGCQPGSSYKFLADEETDDNAACEKVVVAVPREPLDFLERAVETGHPRSMAIRLSVYPRCCKMS